MFKIGQNFPDKNFELTDGIFQLRFEALLLCPVAATCGWLAILGSHELLPFVFGCELP